MRFQRNNKNTITALLFFLFAFITKYSSEPIIVHADSLLRPANLNAQDTSNIDDIQPGGITGYDLDGSGVSVGMWDAGAVRVRHEQIAGRATQEDIDTTFYNEHASHIAGIIAGNGTNNPDAKGMAPNATLFCWDNINDLAEVDANASRISVSNHSYRSSQRNSEKSELSGNSRIKLSQTKTQAWDQIVYDRDLIVVRPAGNERQGEEYNTLTHGAVPKNVITVGAIHDLTDEPPILTAESMADFSSWGPTEDGRIKPDLVASGMNLLSMGIESDNAYVEKSGTSMASAVVTGAVACLIQQYRRVYGGADPGAAMMKAILIHTARDDEKQPGPDYRFGWGLLDARAAADFIWNTQEHAHTIESNQFSGTAIEYPMVYEGNGPIKVSLVWTDPPGEPGDEKVNYNAPDLVNDLNVSIFGADETYYPWSLNPSNPSLPARHRSENHRDNVEQVFIQSPVDGNYTVRIDGQLRKGDSQEYALCITGLQLKGDVSHVVNLMILNPARGELLSGKVPIRVQAHDPHGLSRIVFRVDGEMIDDPTTEEVEGEIVFNPPEENIISTVTLETSTLVNGLHEIQTEVISTTAIQRSKSYPVFILNEKNINPLVLNGASEFGRIWPAGNEDWFLLHVPDSDLYSIETISVLDESSVDTVMTLYGPDNRETGILMNDDGGNDRFATITCQLKANSTYFVKVAGYAESTGLYGIRFRRATENASQLLIPLETDGSMLSSEIPLGGGEQWYMFRAPYLGTYTITTVSPQGHVLPQLFLLDPKNPEIIYASNTLGSPVQWTLLENQYCLVKAVGSKEKITRFSITVDTNANNISIPIFTTGQEETGYFSSSLDEEHWYTIQYPTSRFVLLSLNSPSEKFTSGPTITLYGPDDPNEEITTGYPFSYPPRSSRILANLINGHIYYAKVTPSGWSGSYTIQIQFERELQRAFTWTRSISATSDQDSESLQVILTAGADMDPVFHHSGVLEMIYGNGNWEPFNISEFGQFDSISHAIRWPSLPQSVKHISYELRSRENAQANRLSLRGQTVYNLRRKDLRLSVSGDIEYPNDISAVTKEKPIGIFDNHLDIGFPKPSGDAYYDNRIDKYFVLSGGKGYSHDHHLVYKKVNGDFSLKAKIHVENMGGSDKDWAGAGFFVQDNLERNSDFNPIPYFLSWFKMDGQIIILCRNSPQEYNKSINGEYFPMENGLIQELIREEKTFSFYYINPITGERIFFASQNIEFEDPLYVGLWSMSCVPDAYTTGYFSDVQFITEETPTAPVKQWALHK